MSGGIFDIVQKTRELIAEIVELLLGEDEGSARKGHGEDQAVGRERWGHEEKREGPKKSDLQLNRKKNKNIRRNNPSNKN